MSQSGTLTRMSRMRTTRIGTEGCEATVHRRAHRARAAPLRLDLARSRNRQPSRTAITTAYTATSAKLFFAARIQKKCGHLWSTLLGEKGDPHVSRLHIASYVFFGLGFYLLSSAWNVLYHVQRRNALATTGAYARIRHPQYVAFVMILFGVLLQWPTLLTLVMIPILVAMYSRLAINEERDMRKQFGAAFDAYAARTPRFFPALRKEASTA